MTYINTSDYVKESKKIIINEDMKKYMQKLFIKSEKKKDNFSLLFDNYLLDKINNSKKYTEKHQKFNVDKYNLWIREDKYNITNNIYGWKFNDNDEVININVTEELELTKEPEEIFKIVLNDWIKRGKINITPKSIAGQIYKALNIDINKYIE